MSEPTGYVLGIGIDAPPIMHLNPTEETRCGGRTWNPEDPTLEGSDIAYQQMDEKTALAMLEAGQAIPCRRCGLKDHPAIATSVYGPQKGVG